MRKRAVLLIIAAGFVTGGCLSGFKHPLGAAGQGFIQPGLLGSWSCTSEDSSLPSVVTFIDFDGKQYYIEAPAQGDNETSRSRAHATRVEDVPFLSIREIGADADDEWTILQYELDDSGQLQLRVVDPNAFEDVIDDAAAVEERLAGLLQDPEVVHGLLSCTRQDAPLPEP